jgi:hypothetical protein
MFRLRLDPPTFARNNRTGQIIGHKRSFMGESMASEEANICLGRPFASSPGLENAQGSFEQFPRNHNGYMLIFSWTFAYPTFVLIFACVSCRGAASDLFGCSDVVWQRLRGWPD